MKKMTSIKMLGTGHGFVFDIYNTCFWLKNNDEILLVDTGGEAEIVRRLKQSNIDLKDIHNIFISHCHTDHILGLMWMLKRMSKLFGKDIYKGKLNKLNIKNLILYHTEETHMDNRRELYINEGKQYFSNNIIVPDEMEEFEV